MNVILDSNGRIIKEEIRKAIQRIKGKRSQVQTITYGEIFKDEYLDKIINSFDNKYFLE